jgi:hypothetical protein
VRNRQSAFFDGLEIRRDNFVHFAGNETAGANRFPRPMICGPYDWPPYMLYALMLVEPCCVHASAVSERQTLAAPRTWPSTRLTPCERVSYV